MKAKKNDSISINERNFGIEAPSFPIVGIGASAGGLEALLDFLANVPENSGLTFVIIQHMETDSKNVLAELLQNATTMRVIQAVDKINLQPNNVYIVPPNKNITIEHAVLYISEFNNPGKQNLPIDTFFHSLAHDQKENCIGVILSGMGADGTLGITEIKRKGGGVFIQDPPSAKFDSMPHRAIETGFVDVVSAAGLLPSKIIAYLDNKQYSGIMDEEPADNLTGSSETILGLVRLRTGRDFSLYKKNTIHRRIERRMTVYSITDISEYLNFLKQNPQELDLLAKEFLIGVTSFFRDPAEWELLKNKVIPALLAEHSPNDTVRVWVSGCSTGEEAYSFAIIFKEVLNELNIEFQIQIFATDLDNDAIEKAREGIFPATIAKDMSAERLNHYFILTDQGYQVNKTIRDMVIFAQQNMIKDPPFTKLDMLTCRNLLIYMNPVIQKKLIPLFHYSLNADGFLFLGSAESVGSFTDLFKPLDLKSRIYQRLMPVIQKAPIEFPTSYSRAQTREKRPSPDIRNLQTLVDKVLLQNYSPASVLVNGKGDILYITGRTGKYLEPASGKFNDNIFNMAREGLKTKIGDAFFKACKQNEAVILKNAIVINEGGPLLVDVSINPLKEPDELSGMVMITFNDVATPDDLRTIDISAQAVFGSQREEELERELFLTRQMWQVTNTEMQISKEDYKSSNEELQSCNEELQSANEELTTTKEEIQSSNEELKKINLELQAKLNELLHITDDIKNLMNSTKLAILFLDDNLNIRHFTHETTSLFRLIPSDIGRPITDIVCDLIYPELSSDIRTVQQTLIPVEKLIMSTKGSCLNVRILPYFTLDSKHDGTVMTFADISKI